MRVSVSIVALSARSKVFDSKSEVDPGTTAILKSINHEWGEPTLGCSAVLHGYQNGK